MTTSHRQRMIDQGLSKPRHSDSAAQKWVAKALAADDKAKADAREKNAAAAAKHAASETAAKRKAQADRHAAEKAALKAR